MPMHQNVSHKNQTQLPMMQFHNTPKFPDSLWQALDHFEHVRLGHREHLRFLHYVRAAHLFVEMLLACLARHQLA